MSDASWLTVAQGDAPLLVSLPHTGTDLLDLEPRLISPWLARKDADWWIDTLYAFTAGLGATLVHTAVSRTVIDVNRDPSGVSLYPGQATTGLCPTETFDGEPLYRPGEAPGPEEIASRRAAYFEPYHAAIATELDRLRGLHPKVVLYDCHSIRSLIPRLFEGELPVFNLGTNSGASADPALVTAVTAILRDAGPSFVVDGRFKGGWITRAYGRPADGVHALQMELACRGYMPERPGPVAMQDWPVPFDDAYAAPIRATLARILDTALAFARA